MNEWLKYKYLNQLEINKNQRVKLENLREFLKKWKINYEFIKERRKCGLGLV